MSKRKAGNRDISTKEKVEILKDINILGNVSKVAEKWGVSRQSIYNWKSERAKLDQEMILRENVPEISDHAIVDIEKYKQILSDLGSSEKYIKFQKN